MITLGCILFIITLIDYKFFIYHPFEMNIIVDVEDLKPLDRLKLL